MLSHFINNFLKKKDSLLSRVYSLRGFFFLSFFLNWRKILFLCFSKINFSFGFIQKSFIPCAFLRVCVRRSIGAKNKTTYIPFLNVYRRIRVFVLIISYICILTRWKIKWLCVLSQPYTHNWVISRCVPIIFIIFVFFDLKFL